MRARAVGKKIPAVQQINLSKAGTPVVYGGRPMSVSVDKKKTCLHHLKIFFLLVCLFVFSGWFVS